LAPDFIGFGRSDKPTDDEFYTWDMHQRFCCEFVAKHVLGLKDKYPGHVMGVFQDWGGILGFTLPPTFPNLFTHLLVMNTGFGLGSPPSQGWLKFRDFIKANPNPAIGRLLGRGAAHMTEQEKKAYDVPYPDQESKVIVPLLCADVVVDHITRKAGVRRFPEIVPIEKTMDGVASSFAAYAYFQNLKPSDLRVLVAIGMADPVLGEGAMNKTVIPAFESSTGCLVMKIPEAGHFVQEWGEGIAEKAVDIWSTEKDEDVKIDGIEWRLKQKAAKL